MKSPESKSSTPAALQHTSESNSFFSKVRSGAFDPENHLKEPFFSGIHPVQAKLKIHPADDAFEKEADSIADRVMQQSRAAPSDPPKEPVNGHNIQTSPLNNIINHLQRQRAFESPTILELNTSNLSPGDEIPLQRKSKPDFIQAKKDGSVNQAPAGMETTLNSAKGRGDPLTMGTRSRMESGFGTDFSRVNIHTDQEAVQMNEQINARAFTHGNDIYFNRGEYKPDTDEGDHLLAHELTHSVQQSGDVQKKSNSLQKATKKKQQKGKSITNDEVVADVKGSKYLIEFKVNKARHTLNISEKELNMPGISLPEFKQRNESKYKLPIYSLRGRGITDQTNNWRNALKSGVNAKVAAFLENKPSQEIGNSKQNYYFFYLEQHKNFHIIGTKEQIQENALIPKWNRSGHPNTHQVDHVVEHQLGGEDQASTKPENYELLDSKANMSSGNSIKWERYARIRESLGYFRDLNNEEPGKFPNLPDEEEIKAGYISTFEKVTDWKLNYSGNGKAYWTYQEIKDGIHLAHLKVMPANEMEKIKGKDDEVLIYVSESLGTPKKKKLPLKSEDKQNFFAGLDLIEENFDTIKGKEDNGKIKFKLNRDFSRKMKTDKDMEFELIKLPGRINTYYIKTTSAFNKNQFKKFEGLSPVTLNELTIDDTYGLMLTGTIEPDLPLFKGLSIDFSLSAGELSFLATIPLNILKTNFPKLFNVTDAFLQISYSSKKNVIGLMGSIKFDIEKIGEGEITASQDGAGFKIAGSFIFDKSKFVGQLRVGYSNVTGWSFGGTAKIGPEKLKGVKEAQMSFDYEKDTFIINGNATLTVPGLKTIKIHSTIGKEGDFIINAEAELGQITGIKSGNVKIIIKSKKGEDLKLGVAGTAVPDFPGVPGLDTSLTVIYDDGVFEMRAKVGYKKGRFDGTVEVGVTNKSVDEKGHPQGDPKKENEVLVFGFGSLTVDLFKGSKGTINARLTPDKQLLVAGSFNVNILKPFGEGVNIHKKIIEFPTIKIPLVGVPGVSIFFAIGGGAYFKFNWDPLVLKDLTISFRETNIIELETAQVDIHGEVGSKAVAEAYMEIKASLGAQVLIAEIKGSLAGNAGVGVEAEAGGALDAGWNNEKGLQLKEINVYIAVNPKAIFRLKGSVSVDLDLWVTTINLYYKEWVLAEGSADLRGLSLKVNFPLKFDENGNLIRPGFEQLSIEKPDFSGEQGKAALDSGINSGAEKERKLAKDRLRKQIADDMRSSRKDEDFSPTEYAKKMKKKYSEDEEMKAFIMDSVEEEVKIQEYEEFDQLKNELRRSELTLNQKIGRAMVFKMFRSRISPGDYDAFITELNVTEQQKLEAVRNPAALGQPALTT